MTKGKMVSFTDDRDGDDSLMALVAKGNNAAFEKVVTTHLARIVAIGTQMLSDRALADDLAQDVMLKLWHHAPKWQAGRARISTWLYRVTANLAIDRIRANRTSQLDEDWDLPESATQLQNLEELALKERVQRALGHLPERQRLALILFHYQGLTMEEVANVMETSVEAVQSLLARARGAMKKMLVKEWRNLLPDPID